jgi:hypothetical protein
MSGNGAAVNPAAVNPAAVQQPDTKQKLVADNVSTEQVQILVTNGDVEDGEPEEDENNTGTVIIQIIQ